MHTNEWTTYPTSAEGRTKWDIKRVHVQDGVQADLNKLYATLEEGWEPYSVTGTLGDFTHHFKRKLYLAPPNSIGRDLPDAM